MKKRTIAILMHEASRHVTRNYMVDAYAEFWKRDGHEVFDLFGPADYRPADVVIVHVDLSVVPESYLELAAHYPVALNGNVRDIRKSNFSHHLLDRNASYGGPVIVKSDLNFAGFPERRLTPGRAPGSPFRLPSDYLVARQLGDLPASIFERNDLVVEKFLPEFEDGLFHIRAMVFVGSHASCTRFSSRSPIVNSSSAVRLDSVEPHPEVVELARQLDFQYGKFDYVMHNERPIVFDINKTIGGSLRTGDDKLLAERRYRAEGLYEFFPEEN